jgi:hypothetical protein
MKKNSVEIHNEEVREIMGEIPGWVIRWGLIAIFLIMLSIIIGSYFFKYPEVITAPITLTTVPPPLPLVSKYPGTLDTLFINNNQTVQLGERIALIKNLTNYSDYIYLKNELVTIGQDIDWGKLVKEKHEFKNLSLGEIQNSYDQFISKWDTFKDYLQQAFILKNINLLKNQIESLGGKTKENENKPNSNDIEIATQNTGMELSKLKENIAILQIQYDFEFSQNILHLNESYRNLNNTILQWEDHYLIKSPLNGKITFSKFWEANQVINSGENIGILVPLENSKIIGEVIIPPTGLGKAKVGQLVQIKLSGFPFMEFGILNGQITKISSMPEEHGYVAQIEFPQGMVTNYNIKIQFSQQMGGTADIITKKNRLIYKFINPLKSILKNN